jgi:hypothetical protein
MEKNKTSNRDFWRSNGIELSFCFVGLRFGLRASALAKQAVLFEPFLHFALAILKIGIS